MENRFLQFLSERRRASKITVSELAGALEINVATLHKYLSGARNIPTDRAAMLRGILCADPEDRGLFDTLYGQTASEKNRSPFELTIDSTLSTIKVAGLVYEPFSGNSACFVDKFVRKMFRLARINVEDAEVLRVGPNSVEQFAIAQRVSWIDDKRVNLLFCVQSLQRMRKLAFISLPIRIGINAVLLQKDGHRIADAVELLVRGEPPKVAPFVIVVVHGEVGEVYLQQSPGISSFLMDQQETLDPRTLANRMRALAKLPVLLVVDEHTALQVVRELEGDGLLVLPPNSDQAIIHIADRRIPPAYYFGLAVKRINNWPFISYLMDSVATYVSLEGETLAAWYEELYEDLVNNVKLCLSHTNIYLGGVILTPHRLQEVSSDSSQIPSEQQREWETMVEQTARAIARRTLNLSRRSLAALPPELNGWKPLLSRARERIQVREGGNRGWLRNIIFYCAKSAMGLDPFAVSDDPIGLLRDLANSKGTNRWADFIYLLEREMDTELAKALNESGPWTFKDSPDLGRLTSEIQKVLESSRESQMVVTIREYQSGDRESFREICRQYATEKAVDSLAQDLDLLTSETKRFLAFNLGELVGFIQGSLDHLEAPPHSEQLTPKSPVKNSIRVDHIFVIPSQRQTGVSRRLIRRVIEAGNNAKFRGIWLDRSLWQDMELDKFIRSGFMRLDTRRYWYEFKLSKPHPQIKVKNNGRQLHVRMRSARNLIKGGPESRDAGIGTGGHRA